MTAFPHPYYTITLLDVTFERLPKKSIPDWETELLFGFAAFRYHTIGGACGLRCGELAEMQRRQGASEDKSSTEQRKNWELEAV